MYFFKYRKKGQGSARSESPRHAQNTAPTRTLTASAAGAARRATAHSHRNQCSFCSGQPTSQTSPVSACCLPVILFSGDRRKQGKSKVSKHPSPTRPLNILVLTCSLPPTCQVQAVKGPEVCRLLTLFHSPEETCRGASLSSKASGGQWAVIHGPKHPYPGRSSLEEACPIYYSERRTSFSIFLFTSELGLHLTCIFKWQ